MIYIYIYNFLKYENLFNFELNNEKIMIIHCKIYNIYYINKNIKQILIIMNMISIYIYIYK